MIKFTKKNLTVIWR